jgi:quinol monooxygenase YgiN
MTLKYLIALGAAAVALGFVPAGLAQTSAGITVLTIIDVVPDYAMHGNVDKSTTLLRKLETDTRQASGLISFKILKDQSRDNHFIMESVWKDKNSFEEYTGSETTRAFRKAFQPGEAGPFDERIYVDLN